MSQSIKSDFLILIIFVSFSPNYAFLNTSYSELPEPENSIYAREQLYLTPIRFPHDEALTCGQLIVSRGFQYERHFVTTEDGYILQLYRIVNPYAKAARGSDLVPVLLVHGILVSCGSWMFNGFDGFIKPWKNGQPPNVTSNNLAFVLANLAYDVWIANSRGTSYSRNHTTLNPDKDPEFWDFSFSEMGKYDAPAMVNFIINTTSHDQVVWIGYSQGTQQILTHLAENPSFSDKLALNINISPIAYYGNPLGLVGLIPRQRAFYLALGKLVGPAPPFLPEFNAALTAFCTVELFKPICIEIYNYIFGPDPKMINQTIFPVLTSLIDTTSIKTLLHDLQSFSFDEIRKYDYGTEKNRIIYGSDEPPVYPFQNVPTKNKLVLISGLNDYLAVQRNVQKLRNTLKGRFIDHVITYPDWSHTDIIFGKQAYQYAHSVIVNILEENLPKKNNTV